MACLSRQPSRVPLQWTWASTKTGYAHYFSFLLVQWSLVESNVIKLSDRRRTDSVLVLLRPTPSKLKLCSRSIILEVSIVFYHVDFVFFIFFLNKSQFYCSVFMYCFTLIRFFRQPSLGDSSFRQWWHAPTNFNCANDVTSVSHSKVRSEHRWLLHLSSCMNIKLNGLKENP